jgi:translation initiation factor RLI1
MKFVYYWNMGQIIGITGAIGSGKSTLTDLLAHCEPSFARYESGEVIAEVAEDFNRALSGELAFETTHDDIELVNQSLIWFVEAVSEKLHQDATWNQLAVTKHGLAVHPELFDKMIQYVKTVKKQPQLLEARITASNKGQYRPLLQWLGSYLVARISPTIWYDEIFRRIDMHDSDKDLVLINSLRYPSDALVVREHGGIVVAIERPQDITGLTDPTESSRDMIKPDITIHNNGTLGELESVTEQLWQHLIISKPKKTYTAA